MNLKVTKFSPTPGMAYTPSAYPHKGFFLTPYDGNPNDFLLVLVSDTVSTMFIAGTTKFEEAAPTGIISESTFLKTIALGQVL